MKLRQIRILFNINLLYAYPQLTENQRKKSSGKSIPRLIARQYLLQAAIFLFIFTSAMLPINFPHFPGFFTFYCLIYVLMTLSQAISTILNIFYESKDLKDYLPLPLDNSSIFLSKFLTILFTLLPYLLPLLALFIITAWRAIGPLGLGLALLVLILFALLFIGFATWLVSALVKSKSFQQHKKIATTILLVLTLGLTVGGLMINNFQFSSSLDNGQLSDRPILTPFLPLFNCLTRPFSAISLATLAGSLVLLALLYLLLRARTIPQMFQLALNENRASQSSKKPRRYRNLSQQLFHYNLSLINEPNLWLSSLASLIFVGIFVFSGSELFSSLYKVPSKYFMVFFFIGIGFAYFLTNNTSAVSLIISLDRENLNYIRSLPLPFKSYLRYKFRFATGLQLIFTNIFLLGAAFFFHIQLLLILALFLGNLLGCSLSCHYYFKRDWRLLNLNWTALTQLQQRGGSFFVLLNMFIVVISVALICVISGLLIRYLPWTISLNLGFLALTLLISFFIWRHFQKSFWSKLD